MNLINSGALRKKKSLGVGGNRQIMASGKNLYSRESGFVGGVNMQQ